MFRIDIGPDGSKKPQRVKEVEFSAHGIKEVVHIQEWIAADPDILEPGLLIIEKEFRNFDKVRDRVDLLAVDRRGALVVIELKRDDSGDDVHWQALKYASYFREAGREKIVETLAGYKKVTKADAAERLQDHLYDDDLDTLNRTTRIILASHRFAPHVTSAALWLNEQTGRDLFTCVQLTPFREGNGPLYLQTNTIIPAPGTDAMTVKVGATPDERAYRSNSRHEEYDEIKAFFTNVADLAKRDIPGDSKPDKMVRHGKWQWATLWHSHWAPGNDKMFYMLELSSGATRTVAVSFVYNRNRFEQDDINHLERLLDEQVCEGQERTTHFGSDNYQGTGVKCEMPSLKEEKFVAAAADVLRKLIVTVTPKIDAYFRTRDGAADVLTSKAHEIATADTGGRPEAEE